MNEYTVTFEQNVLNNLPGVDLYNHDFNRTPERDIKINKLARRDMSIITSSEYTQKTIYVYAEVCGGTRAETEANLTTLKQVIQPQNGNLRVTQGGIETEYTATVNEFNPEFDGAIAYVTIVFLASDPLGSSVDQLEFANFSTTSSNASQTGFFEGSGTTEPVINLTFTTVTGGTDKTVTVANARTSQGIRITADYVSGDVLTINSFTKEARLNGVLQDFEGIMPVWSAGTQQVSYNDDFTTRDVAISVSYNSRYV